MAEASVGAFSVHWMEGLQGNQEYVDERSNHLMPFVGTSDLPSTSQVNWSSDRAGVVNSEEEINQHDDITSPNNIFRALEKLEEPTEERLVNWLKKAENGKLDDFIITTPPIRPKGGEVFLYRCKNLTDEDYRRDGYTGMASYYKNSRSKSKLHRIAFQLRDAKKKTIPGFKKHVMSLRKYVERPNKIKLLWYSGDETLWTPRAHGNSHDKQTAFTSNTAACRASIRQVAQQTEKEPMLVYRKAMQNVAAQDEFFQQRQEVVGPRNKKQVQNEMHSLRTSNRVHQDEILAVYLMGRSKMLGEFIREMKLLDREAIVLADTEALNLTKSLIKEASDSSKQLPLCIGFDTTFNLADAYISPLVIRNAFLEGNPIFPCAFLVHERRTHEVHKFFWDTMKTLLPLDMLPLTVPIVSDREAGLLKGMFDSLGKNGESFHHIPCAVHIKRDAEQWLSDNQAPSVDISTYVRELDKLLQCETEEQFDRMYSIMEDTWSQPFVEYMESYVKLDMKRAAHFFTKQFPAFFEIEATSNFTESFNSILKNSAQWKTLRLDAAIMNLFNVTMSHLGEFDRAYKSIGNYRLKTQYKKRRPGFKLPNYAYLTEEQFLEKFRENYEPTERLAPETGTIGSSKALARIACEMNYVTLNSQSLSYTVTGPYDGKKAFVEEDDAGHLMCSCDGPGMCFHKEAYLIVTKKAIEGNRTTYKLSTLRKKTRKTKGPSGRKKVAPINVDDVIPAPDSRAARRIELDDENSMGNNQPLLDEDGDIDVATATPVLKRSRMERQQNRDGSSLNLQSEPFGGTDDLFSEQLLQIPSDCTINLGTLQDSEDEIDGHGVNFYSQHSIPASTASKVSSTGSWTDAHETPDLFRMPTADFKILPSIFKGTLRSLLGNEMIATDIVDNACALWIKVHDFEDNFAFGSTNDFKNSHTNSFDSLRKLVSWAQRSQVLNSDVVVVPMLTSTKHQFALGVIIWQSKEILIINSTTNADSSDLFEALMRMVFASQLVAECPNNAQEWTFLLEQDMDAHEDPVSSGVWCILNAFAICSRQPFWKPSGAVSIQVMRKWIAKCLGDAPCSSIKLRDGQQIYRLTPSQRTHMANYLKRLRVPPISIAKGSYLGRVQRAIGHKKFKKGRCDFENCNHTAGTDPENVIMCCFCRKWFHMGLCVGNGPMSVGFYYCKNCEPRHADYVRRLAQNFY